MKKIISSVLLTSFLAGCSGSLEHLARNLKNDEAIIFGRVNVVNSSGRDITDLCKIALNYEGNEDKKARIPKTSVDDNGLYVAVVPKGKVSFNLIQCATARGRYNNIRIKDNYIIIPEGGKSYYTKDISMNLYYTEKGKPNGAKINLGDSFESTKQLYIDKMNNFQPEPIEKVKWNNYVTILKKVE